MHILHTRAVGLTAGLTRRSASALSEQLHESGSKEAARLRAPYDLTRCTQARPTPAFPERCDTASIHSVGYGAADSQSLTPVQVYLQARSWSRVRSIPCPTTLNPAILSSSRSMQWSTYCDSSRPSSPPHRSDFFILGASMLMLPSSLQSAP